MGKLNALFSKLKKEKDVVDSQIVSEASLDILEQAERAANIVDEGIKNGDLSGVCEQLEELPSVNKQREQYVFDAPPVDIYYWMIALFGVTAVAFLYFVFIGTGTMVLSSQFRAAGSGILVCAVLVIAFNILVIYRAFLRIKFFKRYNQYLSILKHKNVGLVDDLAAFVGGDTGCVVKDLKLSVKNGMIPQGHFGKDDIFFMVSDEVYNKYLEKQALYDRYYKKLSEERLRMKERPEEIAKIIDTGQSYVSKIKGYNDIIKDNAISEKLYRMEDIVKMIFHEVDINPANADKLGMLMNYYLPTTEKLLEAYIDLSEKAKVDFEYKMKKDFDSALDTINNSFEGILDQFYQEQEMDIISDISAMEVMMAQEGLQDED